MRKSEKSLRRTKLAVLKSADDKDLIVTCRCGCDEGVHIRIERDDPAINIDPENDTLCYVTCLSSNWYRDQGKRIGYVIWDKLRKIWAIIRNKDFYYSEILMTRKDFETFREYINGVK